jgi:hypothetical protein
LTTDSRHLPIKKRTIYSKIGKTTLTFPRGWELRRGRMTFRINLKMSL